MKVVRRDLMHALRKKRPEKADDIENVIYHHDNAPPHTSANTELEMAVIGFQRLQHPPYSPDLAPLDFAYFPLLKSHLRGTKFSSDQEIRNMVASFNRSVDKQWFHDVFDKWVERHERCILHNGVYFEKEWVDVRKNVVDVVECAPIRPTSCTINLHKILMLWDIIIKICHNTVKILLYTPMFANCLYFGRKYSKKQCSRLLRTTLVYLLLEQDTFIEL